MDKKDLQIMEILAQNCRVPHTTIAQALKVSKDTITYKIKHLEKTEFIKEYVLFVDARKLGFTRYHILIKLDAGIKDKQELYDKIMVSSKTKLSSINKKDIFFDEFCFF